MVQRCDFLRPYLEIILMDEKAPMLIKLNSAKSHSGVEEDLDVRILDGKLELKFNTGFIEQPVKQINGIRLASSIVDRYGCYTAILELDMKSVLKFSVVYLDEGSRYIDLCRHYYSDKYGVNYIK